MNKLIDFLRVAKSKIIEIFINEKYWKNRIYKKYKIESLPLVDSSFFWNEITINTYSFLDGTSMLTDLALLKALCARTKNCNYFEIGTWRGESAENVSEMCEKCVTLNLSKDEMLQLKLNEKYVNLHGFFSKNNPKIEHLYGNTLHFDFSKLQKFDVIFIDGDHHYNMVKNDTEKVFKHLVKENSIVVWHDYAFAPEHIRYEVFMAILEAVPVEKHPFLYHIQNTMCAIYFPEKLPVKAFQTFKNPTQKFEVKMRAEKL